MCFDKRWLSISLLQEKLSGAVHLLHLPHFREYYTAQPTLTRYPRCNFLLVQRRYKSHRYVKQHKWVDAKMLVTLQSRARKAVLFHEFID